MKAVEALVMKGQVQEQVSIITPTYNSERFIEETIESVINQTYKNWELFVVDDCSTDSTLEIVNNYQKKEVRIKIISLKQNEGAAYARNIAIEKASGRYIAFIDSDDLWVPNKLEKQINFMKRTGVKLCYTSMQKMNEAGLKEGIVRVPSKVNYFDLLNSCVIFTLTSIYDAKSLGKVYMPNIRKRQDYGLWLKILKQIDFAYGMDEVLAFYRVRRNSVSSNKFKAAQYQWYVYRNIEKLNFAKSAYHFFNYAYYGYLRFRK